MGWERTGLVVCCLGGRGPDTRAPSPPLPPLASEMGHFPCPSHRRLTHSGTPWCLPSLSDPAKAPAHILLSTFSHVFPQHVSIKFKAYFVTSPPTTCPVEFCISVSDPGIPLSPASDQALISSSATPSYPPPPFTVDTGQGLCHLCPRHQHLLNGLSPSLSIL